MGAPLRIERRLGSHFGVDGAFLAHAAQRHPRRNR
jgi:hypothetical protein